MHGEVWVATRDINEPNLKVLAGCPLPDRFQSRFVVREQLMPHLGEESFRLTSPQTPTPTGDSDRVSALEGQVRELRAANDALVARIEELENKKPKAKTAPPEDKNAQN